MMPQVTSGKWGDLWARLLSAIVMLALGGVSIWAGGIWAHALIAVLAGLIIWEVARMMVPDRRRIAVLLALISAVILFYLSETYTPKALGPLLLLVPGLLAARMIKPRRAVAFITANAVLWASWVLIVVRDLYGISWMIWLVGLVVLTDVAGYFAGRIIGGPKLIPRFSPKKTWSGAAAGWLAAGGLGFWMAEALELTVITATVLSVFVSMGSQVGDITQSALKRAVGVKDSSTLIPGHGGFYDRFDGMIGAALVMLLMAGALQVIG